MIRRNERELIERRKGNRIAVEVRRGLLLVWQYIRSCFGAGYWRDEKPWVDSDGWN